MGQESNFAFQQVISSSLIRGEYAHYSPLLFFLAPFFGGGPDKYQVLYQVAEKVHPGLFQLRLGRSEFVQAFKIA